MSNRQESILNGAYDDISGEFMELILCPVIVFSLMLHECNSV